MKKLLLTLTAVIAGAFGSFAEVSLENPTRVNNTNVAEVFSTEGAVIALQALEGNVGYYFNGAANKSQNFSENNLFVVRLQANGYFALQNYTTGQYVGCANATFNNDQLVVMRDDPKDAAKFTAAVGSAGTNWTTSLQGIVNGTNTIRLTAHVGSSTAGHLNTNNAGRVPKYYTGTAGLSIWGVYWYGTVSTPAVDFRTSYILGDPIEAEDFATLAPGEYKVIMKVATRNSWGFVRPEQASYSNNQVYFGQKSAVFTSNTDLFTEDYVYTITVNENGKFTIKNYLGQYCPVAITNDTDILICSSITNPAQAGTYGPLSCITTAGYTDYYMLESIDTESRQVHFGDRDAWSYLSTGPGGKQDAGGLGGRSDSNSRTAAAFKLYKAVDSTFPMADGWYRIRNKSNRGTTDGNYLGYYPSNPWYIVSNDNSMNCNNKGTRPIIVSGKIAHLENGDSEADIDGQLWQFIAGEGVNAGKYCLVNKAYPEGAISNILANDQGEAAEADAQYNATRFVYTFDREVKPDSVAWFTVNFEDNFYFTLNNDGNNNHYLCIAGNGKNYQIHRYGKGGNEAAYWTPELYFPETYNPRAVFEEGTAELKALAEGYAAMKAVIKNEECPVVTMPEGTTGANMQEAITDANNQYIEYINKFNNKWVTIYNNRRASGQTNYNKNNPWLAIMHNSNGEVVTNTKTAATKNDDCIWLMKVESNKLRFYNRTTGYQLKEQLLIPSAVENGVMLKINDSANYIHLSGSDGNLMDYNSPTDPGSVWTIAPAEYTFSEPLLSTKEAPRYYRILSDRLMVKGNNPNLKVDGEDRAASGAGETVAYSNLNSNGIYWRIEDAGNGDGSVKIFNLIDGYAMKGGELATGEAEDAAVFYLNKLSDTPYTNGGQSNFRIVNSYALGSTSNVTSNSLNYNSDLTATVSQWSPTGDNRDCLSLDTNDGNGAIFYFIEASEAEIERATEAYIAAVKSRIGVHPIQDEGENLTSLVRDNIMQEYARLVAEHNASIEAINTIEAVNKAKRTGNITNNTAAVKAEVDAIIDKYIVGQHVNLFTKRADATFQHELRYMRDNGDTANLNAVNSNAELSTVWVISKNDAGNYIITNEATGRALGDINATYKTVAPENAYGYELIYNPRFAGFAIHKPGNADNTSSSVNLNASSNVVKWSYAGTENSHWCIGVLPDVDYGMTYDTETGGKLTINGTLREEVDDNTVVVKVSPMPTPDEVVEPQSRGAVAYDIWEFTASEVKAANGGFLSLSDISKEKLYKIETAGACFVTTDGAHTRALNDSFKVNADGTVTGIEEVGAEPTEAAVKVYYDLQGRRIVKPGRGLYICNGKKTFVR